MNALTPTDWLNYAKQRTESKYHIESVVSHRISIRTQIGKITYLLINQQLGMLQLVAQVVRRRL